MPWIRWVSSLLECFASSGSVKSGLRFVRVDMLWIKLCLEFRRMTLERSPGIIFTKLFLSLCLSFLEDDWQLCWLASKRNIICYKKKKKKKAIWLMVFWKENVVYGIFIAIIHWVVVYVLPTSITLSLRNDVTPTTKRPSNIHLYSDQNLLIIFIVTSICKLYIIKFVLFLTFS